MSLKRAESFNVGSTRDIVAPFQLKSDNNVNGSNLKEHEKNEFIDFHNYEFAELEEYPHVAFEKYCGPTPESNWVIPGVLLVGAYPASQDDGETFELITSILKLGVSKFVCLQQEYRSHGVTEAMWRNGHALRPYFEDVRLVVHLKDSIPELHGFDVVDDSRLSFVHFPIKDCGVTDDGRVLELARNLVKAISEKDIIYLHCWGGHGRTGTLVCIMLHLMYGLDPIEAMARCQFVHDLRQCPVVVGSPQTQPQRDQVTRIIHRLSSIDRSSRFLRRTISDVGEHSDAARGLQEQRLGDKETVAHSPRSQDAMHITHDKIATSSHFPLISHAEDSEEDEEARQSESTSAPPVSLASLHIQSPPIAHKAAKTPIIDAASLTEFPQAVPFRRDVDSPRQLPPGSPAVSSGARSSGISPFPVHLTSMNKHLTATTCQKETMTSSARQGEEGDSDSGLDENDEVVQGDELEFVFLAEKDPAAPVNAMWDDSIDGDIETGLRLPEQVTVTPQGKQPVPPKALAPSSSHGGGVRSFRVTTQ